MVRDVSDADGFIYTCVESNYEVFDFLSWVLDGLAGVLYWDAVKVSKLKE